MMVRPATICISLFVAGAVISCDDEGTTTSCDDMPLLGAAGEASQAERDAFERWYEDAQKMDSRGKRCATPPGDPEDFPVDNGSPGAAGAGN